MRRRRRVYGAAGRIISRLPNTDTLIPLIPPIPAKTPVRKTYPLQIPGKHPDRVLDACKHDVRKYVKRQRRVPLPPGVDFWDFDCRFGPDQAQAQALHLAEITAQMDAVAAAGGLQFYVEIIAKHGHRAARPAGAESKNDMDKNDMDGADDMDSMDGPEN